jgi:hypothetical protein
MPEEAPYPWRAMADKLDAVILEDWTTALLEIGGYVEEILQAAGYSEEKRRSIIKALVLTDKTHSYVVHKHRAGMIGLNVSKDQKDETLLNLMRLWLCDYAFEKEATHCIRYLVPGKGQTNERETKKHDPTEAGEDAEGSSKGNTRAK